MDLDALSNIQPVAAPPLLFAKVQQKIDQTQKEIMPKGPALLVNLSLLVLFIVNVYIVAGKTPPPVDTASYAASIQLTSNYSLYK